MNSAAANLTRAERNPLRPGRPELLAPAGDWECAKAAVENGADAIYFGLDRFNARMRAHNFTAADLPDLMRFLHRRGVRGYVTFNTLVFQDEWRDAEDYLRTLIAAGVDAAIVQDVGVCRLIRQLSPDFPIHCSTQMTITSAAGVRFAEKLGANLVVLARECSIREIEKIRANLQPDSGAQTAAAPAPSGGLPLEVFVHGALCVAYSGQCLTSESLGGRSANRGECAQACRMPYDLIADGHSVELGDRRYLLSPQDLSGLEVLPDLVRAGVASLKIEGRLKSPEYVANVTRVYRRALDVLFPEPRPEEAPDQRSPRYDLEMAFSRGLSTGWFRGINNQELVHARFGTKRGVFLGEVCEVSRDAVAVSLVASLKPGDGVVFDAGRPDAGEQGGRVYTVDSQGSRAVIRFGRDSIDFARVHPGDKLWKTNDPELDRRVRQTFSGDAPRFQRALQAEVHGCAGSPLTLILRDTSGRIAQAQSELPLASAEKRPLTEDALRQQLARLGGTPFFLDKLINRMEPGLILPVSELNRLRREAVEKLEFERSLPIRWSVRERSAEPTPARPEASGREPEVIAVIRSLDQLSGVLSLPKIKTVYCEFENPKRYRDAVALFRQSHPSRTDPAGRSIWVAPPRISKSGEEWILQQVLSCQADGYLVRNYDHLEFFRSTRMRGDFSLNVANRAAAEHFVGEFGLERVTASYDLNIAQLSALLQAAPSAWFDITLHQHMPMFHMEHCVFCAFLSSGTDYTNCGRPCESRRVSVRDRVGAEHPLKADAGCRNTVYNARAQTGAEFAAHLLKLGARSFRVEFLNESADEVQSLLRRYLQLLRGEIAGTEVWRQFKLINQLGVTRGQMEAAARR